MVTAVQLLSPEVVPVTVYQCSVCLKRYDKREDAQACVDQPVDLPNYRVGDFVVVKYGYSWYSGSPKWIINRDLMRKPHWKARRHACRRNDGNCFDRCCTLGFYYVITLIDRSPENPHRIRYHLVTMALTGRYRGGAGGYTYNSGHITLSPARKVPATVIKDSKELLGVETQYIV